MDWFLTDGMHGIPIKVEFYSGSRRDEVPRWLVIAGHRIAVRRVVKQEAIGSARAVRGYCRRFVVEAEDGSGWELCEAPEFSGGWEINRIKPNLAE